jgi:hypothetical protein
LNFSNLFFVSNISATNEIIFTKKTKIIQGCYTGNLFLYRSYYRNISHGISYVGYISYVDAIENGKQDLYIGFLYRMYYRNEKKFPKNVEIYFLGEIFFYEKHFFGGNKILYRIYVQSSDSDLEAWDCIDSSNKPESSCTGEHVDIK